MAGGDANDAQALADRLKALSNEARIRLLRQLQDPARLAEIRLATRASVGKTRPMSRQALSRHVQSLAEAGFITRDETAETTYCVDRAGLFELTHALRQLLVLRGGTSNDETQVLNDPNVPTVHSDALVVVRGPREGHAYPVGHKDELVIGRSQDADIVLDHDRFISGKQAQIVMRHGEPWLLDPGRTTNPTYLNWHAIRRGAAVPLRPGDVLGLGMTLLVYRPAQAPK